MPATNAIAITDPTRRRQDQTDRGRDATRPDLSGLSREELEARVKTLTEDLASANAESEIPPAMGGPQAARRSAGRGGPDRRREKLEDKLVQAVKELYQSEMKRREALVLLDKLLDTTDQMIQTAPKYDPKVRAEYEVAFRGAKDYLAGHSGAAIPLATSLADGRDGRHEPGTQRGDPERGQDARE